LRGEPITVFGDGRQTRSFCYVDDLVEGIYRLLQSELHDPVNLGNPEEWTVAQMAQAIKRLTGSSSAIEYHELPVDDPKVRQPDVSLARAELDWQPTTQIEDGLTRTLEDFARRRKLATQTR
jgi:nucleoside-diphosphate-sugar epimerase